MDDIEGEKMIRIIVTLLISVGFMWASEFQPYGVKSGKITFEKRRYSIHTTLHIDVHDNVHGSRSNPYYVEEEIIYYWDNYGDVAFEEAYKVSDFSTKPLPKKIKKYEKLWKGNHRYYYKVKNHKVSDNRYYTREECLRAGKLFELAGWFKVIYPQAQERGKEMVAGKMTMHYRESAYSDYYLYKGLVLREMNYSTKQKNGKELRFEPETERVAVKVEEDIILNSSIFNPKWIKEK